MRRSRLRRVVVQPVFNLECYMQIIILEYTLTLTHTQTHARTGDGKHFTKIYVVACMYGSTAGTRSPLTHSLASIALYEEEKKIIA